VIDDVQQLLKSPANHDGESILAWCLGRSANQQLTVLFISPEPVQKIMKEQSGYIARLSTHSSPFEYIDSSILRESLLKISNDGTGRDLSFSPEQAQEVINVVGTHMSDVRALQRMRIERNMSIEEALQELVKEEARALKNVFLSDIAEELDDKGMRRPRVLKYFICQHIASSSSPIVSLTDLMKSAKLEEMELSLRISLLINTIDQLVDQHVLRRCFINNGLGYGVAFHRPVKCVAFQELLKDEEFMEFQKE
jgi:hypothetical protein